MTKNRSTQNFEINHDKLYNTLTNDHDSNANRVNGMSKSQISGFFVNSKLKTKFEQQMVHKLGYEWKQIYRHCIQLDPEATGILNIDDFLKACQKFGVSLIPLEVKQLMKLFSVASDQDDVL